MPLMEIKDIALLITSLMSIIGVTANIFFQRKTFLLQVTKENENELYKQKLEAYGKILGELETMIFSLLDLMVSKFKNSNIYTQEQLNEMGDKADKLVDDFDNLTVQKSLLFSDALDDKINDLILLLYDSDSNKKIVTAENYMEYHNKLIGISNEINDVMRDDLQLEKLNNKLYNRTKRS